MNLQTVDLAEMNPAPYNPRRTLQPGEPDYEALKKSIQHFSLLEPLVWNSRTGNLVYGHQRYNVLLDLGESQATVNMVDLPIEQEKALNIALNKIEGSWDDDKLRAVLLDLEHIDKQLFGYSDHEYEYFLSLADDDEDPLAVDISDDDKTETAECPNCGRVIEL